MLLNVNAGSTGKIIIQGAGLDDVLTIKHTGSGHLSQIMKGELWVRDVTLKMSSTGGPCVEGLYEGARHEFDVFRAEVTATTTSSEGAFTGLSHLEAQGVYHHTATEYSSSNHCIVTKSPNHRCEVSWAIR